MGHCRCYVNIEICGVTLPVPPIATEGVKSAESPKRFPSTRCVGWGLQHHLTDSPCQVGSVGSPKKSLNTMRARWGLQPPKKVPQRQVCQVRSSKRFPNTRCAKWGHPTQRQVGSQRRHQHEIASHKPCSLQTITSTILGV